MFVGFQVQSTMSSLCVYMSSVSSKQSIFKQQQAIFDFLDARGIEYLPIDMCANTAARPEMLEKIPEEKKDSGNIFLPPQVFNGTDYCGDFEQFFDAREMDLIYSFFKLDPPAGSSELKVLQQYKDAGVTPPFSPKGWC